MVLGWPITRIVQIILICWKEGSHGAWPVFSCGYIGKVLKIFLSKTIGPILKIIYYNFSLGDPLPTFFSNSIDLLINKAARGWLDLPMNMKGKLKNLLVKNYWTDLKNTLAQWAWDKFKGHIALGLSVRPSSCRPLVHLFKLYQDTVLKLHTYMDSLLKVSNGAKIRNRYNQVPHLTQDTNGKVTNSQKTPQTRAKRSALSQQVTTKHISTDAHKI